LVRVRIPDQRINIRNVDIRNPKDKVMADDDQTDDINFEELFAEIDTMDLEDLCKALVIFAHSFDARIDKGESYNAAYATIMTEGFDENTAIDLAHAMQLTMDNVPEEEKLH